MSENIGQGGSGARAPRTVECERVDATGRDPSVMSRDDAPQASERAASTAVPNGHVSDASLDRVLVPSDCDFVSRSYFTGWERQAAGTDALRRVTEDALLRRLKPSLKGVKSLQDLKQRCRQAGVRFETLRQAIENDMLKAWTPRGLVEQRVEQSLRSRYRSSPSRPVRSLSELDAVLKRVGLSLAEERVDVESEILAPVRQAYVTFLGRFLAKEVVAAGLLIRCARQGVIPADTRLATPLPHEIRERVKREPAFDQGPPIETYGDLFLALERGGGESALSLVDALLLARFLKNATQKKLLSALTSEIDQASLTRELERVGFHGPLARRASTAEALLFDAPKCFGLAGRSELDLVQQQCVERGDALLVDANGNGALDGDDVVYRVDDDGRVEKKTYAEAFSPALRERMGIAASTVEMLRAYAALPESHRMQWLDCDSTTGELMSEHANVDVFGTDGEGTKLDGGLWTTNAGVRPSTAVEDATDGSAHQYVVECARARTLFRLRGLEAHDQHVYGSELGRYLFDSRFLDDVAEVDAVRAYLERFRATIEREPTMSFATFSAALPPPSIHPVLRLTRHSVLDANGRARDLFLDRDDTRGPGDGLYVANPASTYRAVREGYVGENVVDLGFRDSRREYYGHPDGIFDEAGWKKHVAGLGFSATCPSDLLEYGTGEVLADLVSSYAERLAGAVDPSEVGEADLVRMRRAEIAGQVLRILATEQNEKLKDASLVSMLERGHAVRRADLEVVIAGLSGRGVLRLAALHDDALASLTSSGGTVASSLSTRSPSRSSSSFRAPSEVDRALTVLRLALCPSGGLTDEARSGLAVLRGCLSLRSRVALLRPPGPLSSSSAFYAWLRHKNFDADLRKLTGKRSTVRRPVGEISSREVRAIIEALVPGLSWVPTQSARANGGSENVAGLLGRLLLEGREPGPVLEVVS